MVGQALDQIGESSSWPRVKTVELVDDENRNPIPRQCCKYGMDRVRRDFLVAQQANRRDGLDLASRGEARSDDRHVKSKLLENPRPHRRETIRTVAVHSR